MTDDRFEALRAEIARRNPYGIHPEAKTGALAPMSQAWQDAAFNLTHKAFERVLNGDDAAADRLIAKAAALGFDEHEQEWPQLLAADQMVFNVLADHAERWRDFQDYLDEVTAARFDGTVDEDEDEPPVPLGTGISTAVVGADPGAIASLRGSIEELVSEASRWEIEPIQVSMLTRVAEKLPEATRARDLPRETTELGRAAVIRAHLDLAKRLLEEFES